MTVIDITPFTADELVKLDAECAIEAWRTKPFILPDTLSALPGALPLRLALNYARRTCDDADRLCADAPTLQLVWNHARSQVIALQGQTAEGGTLRIELDQAPGDISPTHVLITRHNPLPTNLIETAYIRMGKSIREKIAC